MTQYEQKYDEEYDPDELVYMFYVHNIGVETTDYNVDSQRDETYVEEEEYDAGSVTHYFKLKVLKRDIEGEDPQVVPRNNIEYLYKKVFRKIMNNFDNSDYNLYEDKVDELTSTKKFEYCIEYRNKEYIAVFEKF